MSDSVGSSGSGAPSSGGGGLSPSPMPSVSDIGSRSSSSSGSGRTLIDQASQSSLSEKLVKPSEAKPVAAKTEQTAKPAAPPPAPPMPGTAQKYKVKIDGKEQEVTLEEMQKDYQLRTVAQKRMQEAQELKKKIDSVLNVIQSDTGAALKAAGLTDEQIEAFAVQMIAQRQRDFMEKERLKGASKEEQELHRLRQLEKEYKEYQDKIAQQSRAYQFEQVKAGLTSLVIDTLESLPKEYRRNDFVASRALDAWQYAYENQAELRAKGVQITPQSVAKALRAEIEGLGKTLAQLATEAVQAGEPIPKSMPAQPGQAVSRGKTDKKATEEKERLTPAQLLRQITLGQR